MSRQLPQSAVLTMMFIALSATVVVQAAEQKDLVDTAVAAGSFKTLAAALDAADLIPALKGKGPFTVFAPTDEAFAKLPAGTVESLLKPENKARLTAVLTYHVVAGRVPAEQVVKLSNAVTLNGQRVDIVVDQGSVEVGGASVSATDIACSNGLIHVIDSVMLPSSDTIVATADKAGGFKTLLTAAKAAGLAGVLSGEGPLTLFAPTDEAFAKLPAGTVESLLKPENKEKLADILKYHVVSGRVFSNDALKAGQAATLQGGKLKVGVSGGGAKVNDANLVKTDLDASNGVIHVIDAVLMPPAGKKIGAAEGRRMIEHAVARGAKMFNAGHHRACAEVYMTTMREMVQHGDRMPEELVAEMQQVLRAAEHATCPTKQSWTLRHGMNHAYHQMATLQ